MWLQDDTDIWRPAVAPWIHLGSGATCRCRLASRVRSATGTGRTVVGGTHTFSSNLAVPTCSYQVPLAGGHAPIIARSRDRGRFGRIAASDGSPRRSNLTSIPIRVIPTGLRIVWLAPSMTGSGIGGRS
jgi:hypothetical protein